MTISPESYPRLSRPPLREAVIDIRLPEDLPVSVVDAFRSLTLPDLKPVGEVKVGGFKLEILSGKAAQASVVADEVQGIRFQSADGATVLQFRRNGMTFSILKNYKTYEEFEHNAKKLWLTFLNIVGSIQASRLAVRYINAVEVPMGADFDDYLTSAPRLPKGLPQLYSSFLQRVVVPFAENNAYVIITQSFERPLETGLPVVIDIDAITERVMPGNTQDIWDTLMILRHIKNRVFFSTLTAKTLEAYR